MSEREREREGEAGESHMTFLCCLFWAGRCLTRRNVVGALFPLTDSRLPMPTVSAVWITVAVYSRHKQAQMASADSGG